MTDYERGFEDGKKHAMQEIASNPALLFDLMPQISANIQKQFQSLKDGVTPEQRSIIDSALAGKISHTDMLEKLKTTFANG